MGKSDNVIEVESDKISCTGCLDEQKHPVNYINLKNKEIKTCIYCGQKYVKISK